MAIRSTQLRYLVAVADAGQITRAAASLNIAQPALSQAIANLESEVGFALLERQARGVAITPAGELFLKKARRAIEAEAEALRTAQWLARAAQGAIEFGFVGAPPGLDSPAQLEAFKQRNPDVDLRYRELPFPGASTSDWLSEVDIAVSHRPPRDESVWEHLLRREPRAVLAPSRHRLAGRTELRVADVVDETFIGFGSCVEPAWAGFWSLDDHRGEPARVTPDAASGPQEVLAALAVRDALTLVPSSVVPIIVNVLTGITCIPLLDAAPAQITLVGHRDRRNDMVDGFLEFVRGVTG